MSRISLEIINTTIYTHTHIGEFGHNSMIVVKIYSYFLTMVISKQACHWHSNILSLFCLKAWNVLAATVRTEHLLR
jgi:hypothetical protein